jgi:hypothetical protein
MNALEWVGLDNANVPPEDFYCSTRDLAQTRTEKIPTLLTSIDWPEEVAELFSAAIGELVGNCFDHNLGKWRDIPGCWLEVEIDKDLIKIYIADRGQGVLASLRNVLPELCDPIEALKKAFTEIITGRAPEKRGNGLKFVLRSLQKIPKIISFTFISDSAKLFLNGPINFNQVAENLTSVQSIKGTYSEILIKKI